MRTTHHSHQPSDELLADAEETRTDDVATDDAGLLEDEILIEEISIDGMCGVY